MSERIAVVVGTRPEIIKMAEIVHLLGERALLVHTGQHWDHAMSGTFMKQLNMPAPHVSLAVGGATRTRQVAGVMLGLEEAFEKEPPAAIMVQGDTNSVLGASLLANAMNIALVHVEAGLRSFDRLMPEEHNRVVTDHLADLCLAPTEHSRSLLLAEGIPDQRIAVTGNTVVAMVTRALGLANGVQALLDRNKLIDAEFILATVHRPENTDTKEAIAGVFASLNRIAEQTCPVVVPLHPRTLACLQRFGLSHLLDCLTVVEPLGYEDFVALASRASLVISDSGGIQEEATVWKRPVIVVRRSTERPEGMGTFARLSGAGQELVDLAVDMYRSRHQVIAELQGIPSPYGDLLAAQRCVEAVDRLVGR